MRVSRLTWREKWRLWRLGAVERYYFQLIDNSTHPFEDLGDGIYYIAVRSDKFLFGVGLIISSLICFILFWVSVGFYSFPLALIIVMVAYGIFSMYGHLSTKELIISRIGGYLLRIKTMNNIIIEEPVHNCYIKLQRKFDSNRQPHYFLILGGYRLDDIRITKMAKHDGALRLLGSRLAARMGINYFDYENNSTLHKIIHYPGFTTLRPSPEEYARFLRVHYINKDEVGQAANDETLPADTNIASEMMRNRVMDNYKVGASGVLDPSERSTTRKNKELLSEHILAFKRTEKLLHVLHQAKHKEKQNAEGDNQNQSEEKQLKK